MPARGKSGQQRLHPRRRTESDELRPALSSTAGSTSIAPIVPATVPPAGDFDWLIPAERVRRAAARRPVSPLSIIAHWLELRMGRRGLASTLGACFGAERCRIALRGP